MIFLLTAVQISLLKATKFDNIHATVYVCVYAIMKCPY